MEQFQSYMTTKNLGELSNKLTFEDWFRKAKQTKEWEDQRREAERIQKEHELLPNILGTAAQLGATYLSGGMNKVADYSPWITSMATTQPQQQQPVDPYGVKKMLGGY